MSCAHFRPSGRPWRPAPAGSGGRDRQPPPDGTCPCRRDCRSETRRQHSRPHAAPTCWPRSNALPEPGPLAGRDRRTRKPSRTRGETTSDNRSPTAATALRPRPRRRRRHTGPGGPRASPDGPRRRRRERPGPLPSPARRRYCAPTPGARRSGWPPRRRPPPRCHRSTASPPGPSGPGCDRSRRSPRQEDTTGLEPTPPPLPTVPSAARCRRRSLRSPWEHRTSSPDQRSDPSFDPEAPRLVCSGWA
jgi:hypothetical protein